MNDKIQPSCEPRFTMQAGNASLQLIREELKLTLNHVTMIYNTLSGNVSKDSDEKEIPMGAGMIGEMESKLQDIIATHETINNYLRKISSLIE